MVETIIFDIGGVLWHPSPKPLSDKWAARCGLSKAEFDQIVFYSPLYEASAIGKISSDIVWADRNEKLKLTPLELAELRADSWDGIWDDELLAFIETLKPDYKVGILSDASSGTRERVVQRINSDLFDAILFSYEAGMVKPNPEIYKRVLEMLGATAASTLFIDDRPKNVQAALDLGMSSFLYTSTPETILQISALVRGGGATR
jgi:putative hydrolase of the HAD superfamily